MGDPNMIGRELQQLHKPWLNWGLLLIVMFFTMMSLLLNRLVYAFRAVREPFGKTLIVVLTMMLAIPFLYGLAMTTGRVMIISLPFPFLSYGMSHILIEYAVVGLLLGIYRRKDMIALPQREMSLQDKARIRM